VISHRTLKKSIEVDKSSQYHHESIDNEVMLESKESQREEFMRFKG
jgi:hypothetical protein